MKPQTIINRKLNEYSQVYYNHIPLDMIFGVIRLNGGELLQEDDTIWNGFLCGDTGRAVIKVSGIKSINSLYLSWYKMSSGRFEITSYIS